MKYGRRIIGQIISYKTYLHTQTHKHHMNTMMAIRDAVKDNEFSEMQIDWDTADEKERNITREHRRKKGLLRKEQLEILDKFDIGVITCFEYS